MGDEKLFRLTDPWSPGHVDVELRVTSPAEGRPVPPGSLALPVSITAEQLQIQVESDLGTGAGAELNLDPSALAVRQAAYDLLSSRQIRVRLGELTRTDGGLLGYFVDDDYSRFIPESPEVLAQACASGRLTGQLGMLGPGTAGPPGIVPVTHPNVDNSEAPLQARPGQMVRLTEPMALGGSAHATCGLFPRVKTSLWRDWIASALKLLMPTFRMGPVPVDPAAFRVPKTTGLAKDQVFTARPDPASWHDDPISAATQDALLPAAPAVVRERYLRVVLPDSTAAPSPSVLRREPAVTPTVSALADLHLHARRPFLLEV